MSTGGEAAHPAGGARLAMIFSATFACSRCRLRFARRARCPKCGGAEVFALATQRGRAGYRAREGNGSRGWQGMLVRLGRSAPKRAFVPIAVGVGMMLQAAVGVAFEGAATLSVVIAVIGVAVVAFTLLATHGRSIDERTQSAAAAGTRMRVFAPDESARGDTTLIGIARRASVEITSPMSAEPCLVFGIRGEVGEADVADADGGDFDLELPSGERVMISLEHAMLLVDSPADAPERDVTPPAELGDALAELLESRAIIADADGKAVLEEHLVRDGDEVTVIGSVLGGTVTTLGHRGAGGARVLAGDEDRPLVVRRASPPRLPERPLRARG